MRQALAAHDKVLRSAIEANVANTGQVAGRIEDIPPAADIIKQMWAGCREVLAATADRLGPSSDGS
jgi:enoyl-[acyl-carrier protein] reductase II